MDKRDNLIPFVKGQSGNPNGRPRGTRNRSTLVKEWLEVEQSVVNPITKKTEVLSQSDIMTLALIAKARKGDVSAFKELMDSAFGKVQSTIDVTSGNEKIQTGFPTLEHFYGKMEKSDE